jgi:predicted nucleic acid-binding Zn ribbon protein
VPDATDGQQRARLAAEALARAKDDARARGQRPDPGYRDPGRAGDRGRAGEAERGGQPGAGGKSGPESAAGGPGAGGARPRFSRAGRGRGRREDPQPLRAAIDGLLTDHGWRTAAKVGSVFGRWDQIVGPGLAAHTHPDRFGEGELVVIADSTAWATQVRLLAATLVRRLNEELGNGTVKRVVVRGPAPPRQPGRLRVRGRRASNGDYG